MPLIAHKIYFEYHVSTLGPCQTEINLKIKIKQCFLHILKTSHKSRLKSKFFKECGESSGNLH